MQFLRKLGLGVSLFLFVPLLLTAPVFASLNATIIQPTFVKESFDKSGFYDGLGKFILEKAAQNPDGDHEVIVNSLKQVVTADELKKIIEPPLDETYKWLSNPDQPFNVTVSIEPLKQKFMQVTEQNLATKLTGLPRCTSRSQITSDPYAMTCLPQGMSVEQIIAQAKTELQQNQELLNQEQNISLGDQPQADQSQAAPQTTNKVETPKFDNAQLKFYAKLYNIIKKGTPWVIGLTVLAAIGILALSRPFHKGFKRAGIMLVTAGILLTITSFLTRLVIRTALPVPDTTDTLAAAGQKILMTVDEKVASVNGKFILAYLGVGIALIVGGVIWGRKQKDSHPESTEHGNEPAKEAEPKAEAKPAESEKPEVKVEK